MSDVEMSDDEDTKKRRRSKFESERDDDEHVNGNEQVHQQHQKNEGGIKKERGDRPQVHSQKSMRLTHRDYDNDLSANPPVEDTQDEFAALLKAHESGRKPDANKGENRDNRYNNQRDNRNNQKDNRNNNRNNQRNNNKNNQQRDSKYNNQNNNRNNNQNNKNKNNQHKNNNNKQQHPRSKPITVLRFEREFEASSLPTSEEALARQIATFLQEQNFGLIHAIIAHLGVSEALRYVRETVQKEEEGGLMTTGTKEPPRKRSPGGSLFHLVKEGVSEELRKAVFTDERGKRIKQGRPVNSKLKKEGKVEHRRHPSEAEVEKEESNKDKSDGAEQMEQTETTTEQVEQATEHIEQTKEQSEKSTEQQPVQQTEQSQTTEPQQEQQTTETTNLKQEEPQAESEQQS